MHGYSTADGIKTKQHLLQMEVQAWVWEAAKAVTPAG
jgi:hypothetical protein